MRCVFLIRNLHSAIRKGCSLTKGRGVRYALVISFKAHWAGEKKIFYFRVEWGNKPIMGKRKRAGQSFRWPLILVLILFLAASCATKRYWGPSMGRSADSQSTPADALQKALKSASFEGHKGKSLWIEVFTLTDRTGEESAEERFLRSWMAEKAVSQGSRMARSKAEADLLLDVKARVFGVHQTRRDFIPLVYMESTQGVVDLHLTFYDRESGKILQTEDLKGEARYLEYYILYMIGPFKSID
jgi:hypothetical protein